MGQASATQRPQHQSAPSDMHADSAYYTYSQETVSADNCVQQQLGTGQLVISQVN